MQLKIFIYIFLFINSTSLIFLGMFWTHRISHFWYPPMKPKYLTDEQDQIIIYYSGIILSVCGGVGLIPVVFAPKYPCPLESFNVWMGLSSVSCLVALLFFMACQTLSWNVVDHYISQEMKLSIFQIKQSNYTNHDFEFWFAPQNWIQSQHENRCCGVRGPYDWLTNSSSGWEGQIPKYCCLNITVNCAGEISIIEEHATQAIFIKGCDKEIFIKSARSIFLKYICFYVPYVTTQIVHLMASFALFDNESRLFDRQVNLLAN